MKRKIRKFGGGGTMGASDRGYQGGGRDSKGNVSGDAPGAGGSTNTGSGNGGNKTTKPASTKTYKGSKNIYKSPNRDVAFSKPIGFKTSLALSAIGVPSIIGMGTNFAAKQNYKGRQKFATKEGLARDFYKTEGKALKPNSPIGKDYLKSAGYGKNKISPVVGGGNDSSTILPMEVTKPVDPL
ncbi:hypothetical protein KJN74_03825, partial [Candidatus Bathyarchaeota archaeon]|nr:hypothetical protein [Candidatus Bathyarchaeota archaeon]